MTNIWQIDNPFFPFDLIKLIKVKKTNNKTVNRYKRKHMYCFKCTRCRYYHIPLLPPANIVLNVSK